MAEELKHLLEKIQKDGVQKAEDEAKRIVGDAQSKAKRIVDEGEAKAKALLEQAEKDGEKYRERGTRALEQAARDLLISVGQGVETLLNQTIRREVQATLNPDVLKDMLVKMAGGYLESQKGAKALILNEEDQKQLGAFFSEKMQGLLDQGLEIKTDPRATKGYRIFMKDKNLYHDFTEKAIADEISAYVQPQLRDIIQNVINEAKEN